MSSQISEQGPELHNGSNDKGKSHNDMGKMPDDNREYRQSRGIRDMVQADQAGFIRKRGADCRSPFGIFQGIYRELLSRRTEEGDQEGNRSRFQTHI